MTDAESNRDDGEPPTFQQLRSRARALDVGDFDSAVEIVAEGLRQEFEEWKLHILVTDCSDSLDVDVRSFGRVLRDLKQTHERHGRLTTKKQVATALMGDLAGDLSRVKMSNGTLFVYQGNTEHPKFGAFERFKDDRLNSILLREYSEHVTTSAARKEVIDLLKSGVATIDTDAFTGAPTGLAVANGFVVFNDQTKTFELCPHSPHNLARNRLGIIYDPTSRAPRFQAALMRVLGSRRESYNALLQFMACTVFSRRPSQDQVRGCLLFLGAPRTGKSTLIELLQLFVVKEQVEHLAPNHWGKPENLASLASATLCVCTELDPRARLKGAVIKQLLSGELVNARHMRQTIFSFSCSANHVWAANELPRIDEINPSLARRFLCIRMAESLSDVEAQTSLIDVADDEAPGVLNLLLEAFKVAHSAGRYDLPSESNMIVSQMQLGSDLAGLFVRHRVIAAAGGRLWTHEIKRELAIFAEELGMDVERIDSGMLRRVAERLVAEYGANRRKSSGRPFYEGVALASPPAGVDVSDPISVADLSEEPNDASFDVVE